MIFAVPTPLPGKQVPVPPLVTGPVTWESKPLVRIDGELNLAGGKQKPITTNFTGVRFDKLGASTTLTEAAKLIIPPAGGFKNPLESVNGALAVLQALDGAYYVTELRNGTAAATVDVGRDNVTVKNVEKLHPEVKAVVGPYSWVNFTDETISPQLAGQ
jgi:hypothetical protein